MSELYLYLNLPRQDSRKAVTLSIGVSYALTQEVLPFDYFSCQTLSEQQAGESHMSVNMQRLINKIK